MTTALPPRTTWTVAALCGATPHSPRATATAEALVTTAALLVMGPTLASILPPLSTIIAPPCSPPKSTVATGHHHAAALAQVDKRALTRLLVRVRPLAMLVRGTITFAQQARRHMRRTAEALCDAIRRHPRAAAIVAAHAPTAARLAMGPILVSTRTMVSIIIAHLTCLPRSMAASNPLAAAIHAARG